MDKSTRGFSLIETILYILIMAVVLTTIALFLLQLMNARAKTRAISEVLVSAQLIEQRLSEAIRHADSLRVAESSFDGDPGMLSLNMVDIVRTPTDFSLSQDDGAFQVSEASAQPVTLTPNSVRVTNLIFTNLTGVDDAGVVQVQFTLETSVDTASKAFVYDQEFQTTLRIPLN